MENRSVPSSTILPHVTYRDVPAAIDWLSRTFGFREHYRYGEPVNGAQLHLHDAWIMVNGTSDRRASPSQLGATTQSLTVFVDDVDAHFAHAKAQGATILEEPHETVYGEFQYAAADVEGHHWIFSRHLRDVRPQDWGAQVATTGR